MRRMQADNTNKRSAFIFDIDGVLLDIGPLLDDHIFGRPDPQWDLFNAELHTCKPIITYVAICNALWHGGFRIELVTSRAESLRRITWESLNQAGVQFDRLWMRPVTAPHVGSKFDEVARIAKEYNLVAVFEDDPANVKEFTRMGLNVAHVESGYHSHPWVHGAESAD